MDGATGQASGVEASMLRTAPRAALLAAAAVLFAPAAWAQGRPASSPRAGAPAGPLTPAQARAFVEEAEARLLDLSNRQSRADWVSQTHITHDTEPTSPDPNPAPLPATRAPPKAATTLL